MSATYYRFTGRGTHLINDKQGWLKALRYTFFKGRRGNIESSEHEFQRMVRAVRLKQVRFNKKTHEWEDVEKE